MNNKPKAFSTCGSLFLALVFVVFCFGLSMASLLQFDGPSSQSGQDRAAPILTALDRYKNDTGIYPAELDVLVPNYLAAVPRPAWRWPYVYEYEVRDNGNMFVLSFAEGRSLDGDYCGYSSETKKWLCLDSMRPY